MLSPARRFLNADSHLYCEKASRCLVGYRLNTNGFWSRRRSASGRKRSFIEGHVVLAPDFFRILWFPLVQTGMHAPAQLDVLEPVQDEKCPCSARSKMKRATSMQCLAKVRWNSSAGRRWGHARLGVYGQWQSKGNVRHLVAERLVDLSHLLGELDTRSRDFK